VLIMVLRGLFLGEAISLVDFDHDEITILPDLRPISDHEYRDWLTFAPAVGPPAGWDADEAAERIRHHAIERQARWREQQRAQEEM
jgi:hypothetical protein